MSQVRVVVNSYRPEADSSALGATLFKNIKFFILQRVPQRSTFVQTVEANGGEIVRLEKYADIIIGDHLRKDNPSGTYSYRWIEQSISEAKLVDKETYLCGPSPTSSRPVGALRPAKGSRVPYSREDDIQLYKWVKDREASGERVQGNELYKAFEKLNDRHPWQSWRDRYIKKLQHSPPTSNDTSRRVPQSPISGSEEVVSSTNQQLRSSNIAATVPTKSPKASVRQEASLIQSSENIRPDSVDTRTSKTANFEQTALAEPESREGSVTPIASPRQVGKTSETLIQPSTKSLLPANGKGRPVPSKNSFTLDKRLFTPKQGQKRASLEDVVVDRDNFTGSEHWTLLEWAHDVQHLTVRDYEKAWKAYGKKDPSHSAIEWEKFYEDEVLPVWEVFEEDRDRTGASEELEDEPSLEEWLDFLESRVKPSFDRYIAARRSLLHTGLARSSSDTHHVPLSKNSVESFARQFVRLSRLKRKPDVANYVLDPLSSPVSPTRHDKTRKPFSPKFHNSDTDVNFSSSSQDNSTGEVEAEAEHDMVDESHEHGVDPADTAEKSRLPFDIYESREIPEGEEENMIYDEFGNLSFPEKYKHIKRDDALDAFQDNSQYFTLVPTQEINFGEASEYSQRVPTHTNFTSRSTGTDSESDDSSSAFDTAPAQPKFNEQMTLESDQSQSQYHDARETGIEAEDIDATGPDTFSIIPPDSMDNRSQSLELEQEQVQESDQEETSEVESEEEGMSNSKEEDSQDSQTEGREPQSQHGYHQDLATRRGTKSSGQKAKASQPTQANDNRHIRLSLPLDSSPLAAKSSTNRGSSHPTPGPRRATSSELQDTSKPSLSILDGPNHDHQPLEVSEPLLFLQEDEDIDEIASVYTTTSEADISQFEQFIADQTKVEGHKREVVDWALHMTSCNMELAAEILRLKRNNRALPINTRGIWHEQDDKALMSGNETQLKRLRTIHGKDGVEERREFLEL